MNNQNFYEILDAEPQSSHEEIRSRFMQKIKEAHPDKGGSQILAEKIIKAWKTLGDEEKRKEYDIWLQSRIKY